MGSITNWLAAMRGGVRGRCVLCFARAELPGLCSPCSADLPLVGARLCPVCALPSPDGAVCGDCRAHPPGFDRCLAAHAYAFPVDRLVQGLKYRGLLSIAPALGHRLAIVVRADRVPDIVLPMPLAAARLRERGFNQALEIARLLPRHLAARLRPGLLERTRDTQPQAELPLDQRARNMRGAFVCRERIDGSHVAIVDDVMTTGATLDAAAAMLKQAGAASVSGWIVARTLLGP